MAKRTINISEITLGMELAEPVKNRYEQMLLSAGTQITENHIKLFKTWGVQTVQISAIEEETTIELTTNLDFETMSILKKRLNWTPLNENEADIYNLAVQMISNQRKS